MVKPRSDHCVEHYYRNTQGVIFVVDSNDRSRISEARDTLQNILSEDEIRNAVLLVFANKQDLPDAMSAAEITEKLGLQSIRKETMVHPIHLCHHWCWSIRRFRMVKYHFEEPSLNKKKFIILASG